MTHPRRWRARLAGEKWKPSAKAMATTALESSAASTRSLRVGSASTFTKKAVSCALDTLHCACYKQTLGLFCERGAMDTLR